MTHPDLPAAAPVIGPSLTHRTARGFAWMSAQTVITKLVTTVGQVVIAYFLLPEHFGLAALAYMFSIVPVLIQQGGLKEVLISRRGELRRWANAAFWMSLSLGLIGGALMAAFAPLAAYAYDEPRLVGLLLIVALAFPLESLSVVPLASIQAHMRFRLAAAIYFGQAATQAVLTIAFAWAGLGPYSLLLPRPIVSLLTAVVCWSLAPVPLRRCPQIRRWRLLVGDGALVIAASACELVMTYAGYFVLSLFYAPHIVGLYYFAFNLSTQTFTLVTQNLGGVLFPALSHLQDEPKRQTQAFLRALKLLACVAIPACFLQAALGDPGVHLFFMPRWWEAIPALELLSIGMAARAIGWPAVALMQAQGRFASRLVMAGLSLALFAALVLIGARFGATGVAAASAAQMLIVEPIALRVAVHPAGARFAQIGSALAPAVLLGILSVGPAWLIGLCVPQFTGRNMARCGIVLLASAAIYLPMFRWIARDTWAEAAERLHAVVRDFKRRKPGRCTRCNYDLRGQVAQAGAAVRCPECGAPISPA